MVVPAASSAAHRLPATTWLTSARTSHPWHGVGAAHWPGRTPAMTPLVASSARLCSSAMPMFSSGMRGWGGCDSLESALWLSWPMGHARAIRYRKELSWR